MICPLCQHDLPATTSPVAGLSVTHTQCLEPLILPPPSRHLDDEPLRIPRRVVTALGYLGVVTVEQLVALTEEQLRLVNNVGETNVRGTVAALREYGLTLHPGPARFRVQHRSRFVQEQFPAYAHLPLLPDPDAGDHTFVAQEPVGRVERDLQVAQRRERGTSFQQIGVELGVSESTVRERMRRHNTRTHQADACPN